MTEKFDALIIGAGQSGPSLAAKFAKEGYKTALIEKDHLGGSCVNYGCTPTKTMVASARVAHMARRATDYGVLVSPVQIDMKKVKARVEAQINRSRNSLQNWLGNLDNLELIFGMAEFIGEKTLRVNDRTLQADNIIINTGTRERIPALDGLDHIDYLTNKSILELDFVPQHLIVIGGSYIGLEFAQVFRRLGSEVTIVEMKSHLANREDTDTSEEIQKILENEGIRVHLNAECIGFEKQGEKIAIRANCDFQLPPIEGSHLLLAVGRLPNSDQLNLDKTGVEVNARGYINTNDQLETNMTGIWATGDVNGKGQFTHTSWNDFEIVAANLFDGKKRQVTDRYETYALFIDPPLGRVGMTEKQARESGKNVLIAKMPMSQVGRALERDETQGFMKVLVDKDTERFLGAAILGIEGDEVIHAITDLMYADAPYTVMQNAVHIHPTVSELLPTLLGKLEPLK